MAVVIQDVRNNLAGMSSDRLSDDEIKQQIEIATRYVQHHKGKSADAGIVNDCILWYSTWQCYLVYIAEYERSTGRIPGPVIMHLRRYEAKAAEYLDMIKRGTSNPTGLVSTASMRTNRIEDYR